MNHLYDSGIRAQAVIFLGQESKKSGNFVTNQGNFKFPLKVSAWHKI